MNTKAIVSALLLSLVSAVSAANKPNIIFVMLDDISAVELSCYELAGIDPKTVRGLDGKSFKAVLDGKTQQGKPLFFSYNDVPRTVRTDRYMMDGSGGIWEVDRANP